MRAGALERRLFLLWARCFCCCARAWGGMALLRGKGWGLDGAQAVGFAAMLLLAAQAQALQLALRPTAEGSQAAFTALLWVPQLYGAAGGAALCGPSGVDKRRRGA